jgi:ABC-type branched-subunit amino acid transport system ATPase component
MLEVRGLDAFYGDGQVLHGVSLSVPQGGAVALVGRNGTGKTTLLKSIMGAGPRVNGSITFDGVPIGLAVTMNIGPLVLANIGPPPGV